MRPVVTIYSTFMQRAYDQVIHDVCLQKLPVTFAMDRGGLVGADGPTHHGVFDMSFLRHVPNLTFAVPRDEIELQRVMKTASEHEGPFAYRYPRGNGLGLELPEVIEPVEVGRGELLRQGSEGLIIALGTMVQEALVAAELLQQQGLSIAVMDARFVKPIDEDMILSQAGTLSFIITAEENSLQGGGFGSAVLELLNDHGLDIPVARVGIPDHFVGQGGTQNELREELGLTARGLCDTVNRLMACQQQSVSAG